MGTAFDLAVFFDISDTLHARHFLSESTLDRARNIGDQVAKFKMATGFRNAAYSGFQAW